MHEWSPFYHISYFIFVLSIPDSKIVTKNVTKNYEDKKLPQIHKCIFYAQEPL